MTMTESGHKQLYQHMIQFFPAGKCITFLLNQIGRPATQLAHENNVGITYMSHMINGTRTVTPAIQYAITKALGFDPWAG